MLSWIKRLFRKNNESYKVVRINGSRQVGDLEEDDLKEKDPLQESPESGLEESNDSEQESTEPEGEIIVVHGKGQESPSPIVRNVKNNPASKSYRRPSK